MTILYKVHDNLYVNLTNKCPCACTFCIRHVMDHVGQSDSLWLDREPTVEEVIAEFHHFDISEFDELVFCGFGEPTERLDTLLAVARYFKETYHKPIRLNTNGLGSLIQKRNIAPELAGLIDTVSISLNTPNADRYHELVRSRFGEQSFDALLQFARECTHYVPHVVLTTVDTTISKSEELQCQAICDSIGAKYRIRPLEE